MVQEWDRGAAQQEDHHLPRGQVRSRLWGLLEDRACVSASSSCITTIPGLSGFKEQGHIGSSLWAGGRLADLGWSVSRLCGQLSVGSAQPPVLRQDLSQGDGLPLSWSP